MQEKGAVVALSFMPGQGRLTQLVQTPLAERLAIWELCGQSGGVVFAKNITSCTLSTSCSPYSIYLSISFSYLRAS